MQRLMTSAVARLGIGIFSLLASGAAGAEPKAAAVPSGPGPNLVAASGPVDVVAGDPRGPADLTICSQNLKLFGTLDEVKRRNPRFTEGELRQKVDDLVRRFHVVRCDVIALQEVLAKNQAEGEAALKPLIEALRARSGRSFEARVGPPGDGGMALGFLVAQDRASVLNMLSYARVELPKLTPKQRPRIFSRTPLEVQLSVKSREGDLTKVVTVVNFHLKSKRGGEGDPTGLEWETFRMEMAEGFRKIIEVRHQDAFASGSSILVVLGDRNSDFDVASAKILEGSLNLASFQQEGGCRVSKRGVPVCQSGKSMPQRLFSVVTSNSEVATYPGTFEYKGEYSWLDDILMPAESLPYAWVSPSSEAKYNSGVVSQPQGASDHSMVWAKLNW